MTDIQVRYWANQETGRHNLATEEQAQNELSETNRHNLVSENVSRDTLTESKRHNVATESQAKATLKETTRSNKANESIQRANTKVQAKNAKTNAKNASTNAYNAQTQRAKANAEIALNNAKTTAQEWINSWKRQNPTTASLKEAGITLDSKTIKNVLATAGLASDMIFQSTSSKKTADSSVKKISAAINGNKNMTAIGSYGNYTIYRVTTGKSVSDTKTVIYDRKTGKFVDKIKK